MSSFNPAFGGFGYDHGCKQNFSLYGSRPAFGQSRDQFGYDLLAGGIYVPVYGHSGNRSYPCGYSPTGGGISTSPFGYSSHPFGFTPTNGGCSAPAFGHDSHPFGFNPSNGGNSVPAFGHNGHPFGFNHSNGGSSAPAFGHNSRPFGFTPAGGGTSAPTLGQSNSFGFTPGGTFVPTFGQNSATPFGGAPANGGTSVPTFGQNSATPFAGAPANGGTCVPTFGQNSSPFGSAPANGGTSVPRFGQTSTPFGGAPANGGASVPTFGQNSTPFGGAPANAGTSMPTFGQNSTPFGSAPANGGTSMPTFGRSSASFGLTLSNGETSVPTFWQNSTTPFGDAPASGGTSVPTFGQSSTIGCATANGGTSVPAFGRSTNSFGFNPSNTTTSVPTWQHINLLGSVSPNGGTPVTTLGEGRTYCVSAPTPTDGGTSVPFRSIGSTSFSQTPAVNASNSLGFGIGCTTTCNQPTLPAGSSLFGTGSHLFGTQNHSFGSTTHSQTPTMNVSSSPEFSFGCTTSGQAPTQFGTSSNLFGTSTYSGGNQVPFAGNQVKTLSSGNFSSESFTFSINRGGTRATPYTETVELEGNPQLSTRIVSISAMPVFQDKSHEELRWEDKQLGDNGNIPLFHSAIARQSAIGSQSKGSKVKPYTETMVGEDASRATSISAMPVYQYKSHEELRWEDHQFNNAGGGVDPASEQLNCFRNPVPSTGSSFLYAMNSSVPPNLFPSSAPCFSNPFTSNSSSNDLHWGAYTSVTQPPSIFGPTIMFKHPYPSNMSASASEASTSGHSLFNYTSAPCASICSTSVTTPVTASVPCNFPPSTSTLNAGSPSRCMVKTPPAVPQMSAEGPKTASVRYGISSIPVKHSAEEKQQLLKPKWNHNNDGPKVSFSADAHGTPTKKAPIIPKHNSGILISGPSEGWNLRIDFENILHIKCTSIHVYENGEVSVELSKPLGDGSVQDKVENSGKTFAAEHSLKPSFDDGKHPFEKEISSDASGQLPKLKDSDYFIQPRLEELAIKESFEPGFCSHVKDFVVGHQSYGRIKFLGETDVRQLDVNSHIVFRNREVILSMDENKKPPVGQGLNKAAEITLCNIKCVDKAGNQHINGPKVDKYRKKLMKKAAEQGAEFVSYDPVQGEWKFRVEHF
ncbi:Peptidase S59 domain-containing protein [Heracleum sosnowskyi]|uniref:Peptidase S59 domain-containing protein n=1 Tax=Heracleum sosnowskyi TaxID=360622 RepID=A0AAD8M822_9APIA|nr:Peptidase S59 domain-containing protein [Heracleum sosnowskyi]